MTTAEITIRIKALDRRAEHLWWGIVTAGITVTALAWWLP